MENVLFYLLPRLPGRRCFFMQITKLEEGAVAPKPDTKVFTLEELQQEFDFILAEKIVRKMAEKGLISDDELHKISEKNRLIFSPYLSEIYQ